MVGMAGNLLWVVGGWQGRRHERRVAQLGVLQFERRLRVETGLGGYGAGEIRAGLDLRCTCFRLALLSLQRSSLVSLQEETLRHAVDLAQSDLGESEYEENSNEGTSAEVPLTETGDGQDVLQGASAQLVRLNRDGRAED